MKERPILFSGSMVRAILDGRKTQTRRKMKPRPPSGVPDGVYCDPYNGNFEHFTFWTVEDRMCNGLTGNVKIKGKMTCHWKCPYGVPGDRLWVRESFGEDQSHGIIFYRADFPQTINDDGDIKTIQPEEFKWSPSIHMPRWASRIILEIVNVRVERLNYISEEDAKAEGVNRSILSSQHLINESCRFAQLAGSQIATAQYQFAALWNSIYRPGSWEKNPWVWVVEFKRIA
jgi:hypothetical protein